jgi:DNA-binding NtrC family response regulator
MTGRLLIIDDDVDSRQLLAASLATHGFQAETCASAAAALARLEAEVFDAIITDVHMAGMTGIELCERLTETLPGVPVIVVTGQASMELAISALRAGADDFVTKPIDLSHLLHRIQKALRRAELEVEVRRLQRVLHDAPASGIIGDSLAITRVLDMIDRVAESDVPVLVTGESGVGKELVARELHRKGMSAHGPFVALNCAAVPATLLESELFGHARGAFTDAKRAREGLFVRSSGGTLFLDEIGELPLEMQPKLLRALQEHEVRPVGSDRPVPFDARIVTATNRDLESAVEDGTFREDLFYRINVINIHVPPLRTRGTDILLLAQHFLTAISERTGRDIKRLGTLTAEKMMAYDWPGNVRELENCMERAVALARLDELTPGDLPDKITRYERGELVISSDDPEDMPTLEALEDRYIRRVLEAVKGNKTQAAKILGLPRRTFYRRLERLASNGNPSTPET